METAESSTGGTNDELSHIESINISDNLETANEAPEVSEGFSIGDEPPIGDETGLAESEFLSPDQFFEGVFVPLHAVPGAVFQLQSLPIASHERQSARAASDALYETALEFPMFHFLIKPENIWVQRALAIGAYAIPKAQAVAMEIRAKKAKPSDEQERQ